MRTREQQFRDAELLKTQEFTKGQTQGERDWRSQEADVAWQRSQDAADEASSRALKLESDLAQQVEDRGMRGIQQAVDEGDFSEEEAKEARMKVKAHAAKLDRFRPVKKPATTVGGHEVGVPWNENGVGHVVQSNGEIHTYTIPKTEPSVKDIATLYQHGTIALQKPDPKNPGGFLPVEPKEIDAWVERVIKLQKKFSGDAQEETPSQMNFSDFTRQAVFNKEMNAKPPIPLTTLEGMRKFRLSREAKANEAVAALDQTQPAGQADAPPAEDRDRQLRSVLATIETKADFVDAFRQDQGRDPTPQELDAAKRRGYFNRE
jgi:hypothetical protein